MLSSWMGSTGYLKEHGGEEPAELVLHPEHIRMLSDELGVRRAGVRFDLRSVNNIPVLEDPCCRVPWLLTANGWRWDL